MAKIDRELVFKLADELNLEGISVTNLNIRKRNGNKGSLTNIAPLLKEWKTAQLKTEDDADSMPEDLVLNTIKPLWGVLKRQARIEVIEKTEAFDLKEKKLTDEIAVFETEFDRQESLLFDNKTDLDNAEKEIAELTERYQEKSTENTKLEQNIASCNNTITQLKALLETANSGLDDWKTLAEQLEKKVDDLIEKNNQQEDTLSDLNSRLNKSKNEVEILEASSLHFEEQLAEEKLTNKELNFELKKHESTLLTSELEVEHLKKSLEKSDEIMSDNKEKIEAQNKSLQAKEVETSSLYNQVQFDKERLEAKDHEIRELHSRLEKVEKDKAQLHENIVKLSLGKEIEK